MRDTLGVRAFGGRLQAPAAEHVELIQKALLERRRLDMLYYSLSREETNRRQVDPYHLTFFDGAFYLIGHCHWRKTERIFAVERIREIKLLLTRFERPADFNAEEYLKHPWGIIQGELVTVKVILSRSVARYIRERLWHPTQKFRELSDGRLEMSLRVADKEECVWHTCSRASRPRAGRSPRGSAGTARRVRTRRWAIEVPAHIERNKVNWWLDFGGPLQVDHA